MIMIVIAMMIMITMMTTTIILIVVIKTEIYLIVYLPVYPSISFFSSIYP